MNVVLRALQKLGEWMTQGPIKTYQRTGHKGIHPVPKKTEIQAAQQQFLSRLATQPTLDRERLYRDLIAELINAGIWQKLDVLYVMAAFDEPTALTNLIQAGYTGINTQGTVPPFLGPCVFTQDAGLYGQPGAAHNDKGAWINSQFIPNVALGHYAQNDCCAFIYLVTPDSKFGGNWGGQVSSDTGIYANPAGSQYFCNVNSSFNQLATGQSPGIGLVAMDRQTSNLQTCYINGVADSTQGSATIALIATELDVCSAYADESDATVAVCGWGASLGATGQAKLFQILRPYIVERLSPSYFTTSWNIGIAAGGGFGDSFWTYSNGNRTITKFAAGSGSAFQNIFTRTNRKAPDKRLIRFDWSLAGGTSVGIGVTNGAGGYNNLGGKSIGFDGLSASISLYEDGKVYLDSVMLNDIGMTLPTSGFMLLAIDQANRKLWYRLNGTGNWNGTLAGDPAAGTGGISTAGIVLGERLFAAGNSSTIGDVWTLNPEPTETLPTGFSMWDAAPRY